MIWHFKKWFDYSVLVNSQCCLKFQDFHTGCSSGCIFSHFCFRNRTPSVTFAHYVFFLTISLSPLLLPFCKKLMTSDWEVGKCDNEKRLRVASDTLCSFHCVCVDGMSLVSVYVYSEQALLTRVNISSNY